MANLKNSEDLQPLDDDSKAKNTKSGSVGRGEAVLGKMVEENLKLTQEMHKMVKSIKRYIFMQQLMTVVKIIFFLAIISAGFIFLPPIVENLFNYYKEFLGSIGGLEDVKDQLDAINLDNLQSIPGFIKQK